MQQDKGSGHPARIGSSASLKVMRNRRVIPFQISESASAFMDMSYTFSSHRFHRSFLPETLFGNFAPRHYIHNVNFLLPDAPDDASPGTSLAPRNRKGSRSGAGCPFSILILDAPHSSHADPARTVHTTTRLQIVCGLLNPTPFLGAARVLTEEAE